MSRSRFLPLSLLLGVLGVAFVSVTPRRSVARAAEGMGGAGGLDLAERRAKCPLTQEQLEEDHGEQWAAVRDILVGLRAPSPEAMMRVAGRGKGKPLGALRRGLRR